MPVPITTSPADTSPGAAAPPRTGGTPPQFTGSIPDDYDRYLGPLLFEFSGRDMARRIGAALETEPAPHVLEVACGTGISTEHLWKQLPSSAQIVATDISPAMLTYAIERRGDLPGIRFQEAPADALPFADASFDALVCQFGIMFFEDKAAALAEFARVLKPGGVLAFSVWESHEKNPVVGLSHRTIASFFASDPPAFLKLPFSYHDTDAISALVRGAGFASVEAWRVQEAVRSNDAAGIARGFVMGNPTVLEIGERGTASAAEIIRTLAREIELEFDTEERSPDGRARELSLPLEEITFTARRPSRIPGPEPKNPEKTRSNQRKPDVSCHASLLALRHPVRADHALRIGGPLPRIAGADAPGLRHDPGRLPPERLSHDPFCEDMLISLVHAGGDYDTAGEIFGGSGFQGSTDLLRRRLTWLRAVVNERGDAQGLGAAPRGSAAVSLEMVAAVLGDGRDEADFVRIPAWSSFASARRVAQVVAGRAIPERGSEREGDRERQDERGSEGNRESGRESATTAAWRESP